MYSAATFDSFIIYKGKLFYIIQIHKVNKAITLLKYFLRLVALSHRKIGFKCQYLKTTRVKNITHNN